MKKAMTMMIVVLTVWGCGSGKPPINDGEKRATDPGAKPALVSDTETIVGNGISVRANLMGASVGYVGVYAGLPNHLSFKVLKKGVGLEPILTVTMVGANSDAQSGKGVPTILPQVNAIHQGEFGEVMLEVSNWLVFSDAHEPTFRYAVVWANYSGDFAVVKTCDDSDKVACAGLSNFRWFGQGDIYYLAGGKVGEPSGASVYHYMRLGGNLEVVYRSSGVIKYFEVFHNRLLAVNGDVSPNGNGEYWLYIYGSLAGSMITPIVNRPLYGDEFGVSWDILGLGRTEFLFLNGWHPLGSGMDMGMVWRDLFVMGRDYYMAKQILPQTGVDIPEVALSETGRVASASSFSAFGQPALYPWDRGRFVIADGFRRQYRFRWVTSPSGRGDVRYITCSPQSIDWVVFGIDGSQLLLDPELEPPLFENEFRLLKEKATAGEVAAFMRLNPNADESALAPELLNIIRNTEGAFHRVNNGHLVYARRLHGSTMKVLQIRRRLVGEETFEDLIGRLENLQQEMLKKAYVYFVDIDSYGTVYVYLLDCRDGQYKMVTIAPDNKAEVVLNGDGEIGVLELFRRHGSAHWLNVTPQSE